MKTALKNHAYNSTNVRAYGFKERGLYLFLEALRRWAPGYAQKLVSKMFFTPSRPPLTEVQKQLLDKGQAFEQVLNGKTIRCWQWGQGPVILLAHGWNGRGISFLRFIEPMVKAGYAVIAFDAPGHGASDGNTTSYFEFTDVLRAFIKPDSQFNIAGIIGHSFGAGATVNALSKEQKEVPVVLIAPALKLKEILYKAFDRYGIPKNLYLDIIADYEHRFGYHLDRDNPIRLLPTITSPILVFHDQSDNMIPYLDSRSVAQNHAMVQLHTTTGLGHKRILLDETVLCATRTYFQEHHQPTRLLQFAT